MFLLEICVPFVSVKRQHNYIFIGFGRVLQTLENLEVARTTSLLYSELRF